MICHLVRQIIAYPISFGDPQKNKLQSVASEQDPHCLQIV